MRIDLPVTWVIMLNIIGWPVIHVVVARVFIHISERVFNFRSPLFHCGAAEKRVYERLASIRNWKRLLPDGAPWLRGFAKKKLIAKDLNYLNRFARETCRAELAHWVMLCFAPFFFLWNPLWADIVMLIYGLVANVPCILAQRYNRGRLMPVILRSEARKKVAFAPLRQ
jgi:glycosyl-4,4'-diaponeurosporenoate acyltransferase